MAEAHDVAIVGAGPAGQAAALALGGHGLRIAAIDEQQQSGGQILRQPPPEIGVRGWMRGRAYKGLREQLQCFQASDEIEWLGGQSVLGIAHDATDNFTLTLSGVEGVRSLKASRVLVAAGCQDLAVPLPGWTLPGVYAAGGIQAFVKSQQIVPGARMVLFGTHPLQLLIASQVVEAGGTVAAVLFAQPRAAMARFLARMPHVAARHAATLLPAAAAMATLKRHGVPVKFGARLRAIRGSAQVEAVTSDAGEISCDAVGLCYGFVPQSALPRMAGAEMRVAGAAGGWATVCDGWMRSSVSGLSVAGETTGVAGAQVAMIEGRIAGTGIAMELGLLDAAEAERRTAADRSNLERAMRFAALLDRIADPRTYFPLLGEDTCICRCEGVALGDLKPFLDGRSANAVKLASRCGMGPCQGRNCEPTLLRLLDNPEDKGFTARFPARPVMLGDLASEA